MYGSAKTDPIVRYYDLAFGTSGRLETEWYLGKARAFGGPVLDLVCGTGRLALLVEQADVDNLIDQVITTTVRVTRIDTEGSVVEVERSTWTTRYLYRYEAIHLLYRCGLEVEALVGDYRDGPVTEGGQLIVQARRADREEGLP